MDGAEETEGPPVPLFLRGLFLEPCFLLADPLPNLSRSVIEEFNLRDSKNETSTSRSPKMFTEKGELLSRATQWGDVRSQPFRASFRKAILALRKP